MRLISNWATAISAPPSAVMAPMVVTNGNAPLTSKIGKVRATRKTPAATMVAAWMRAETGVGPSIASGSQTCSGNCADLPIVPAKISRAMAVAVVIPSAAGAVAIPSRNVGLKICPSPVPKSSEPACVQR